MTPLVTLAYILGGALIVQTLVIFGLILTVAEMKHRLNFLWRDKMQEVELHGILRDALYGPRSPAEPKREAAYDA